MVCRTNEIIEIGQRGWVVQRGWGGQRVVRWAEGGRVGTGWWGGQRGGRVDRKGWEEAEKVWWAERMGWAERGGLGR